METIYDLGAKMIESLNKEKVMAGYYFPPFICIVNIFLVMLFPLTRPVVELRDLVALSLVLVTMMPWDLMYVSPYYTFSLVNSELLKILIELEIELSCRIYLIELEI
jgi:hypothetical protein